MDIITQEAHNRQRILEYLTKHGNVTETGRIYHVSRKTIYKWLKRWDGTWKSLTDQSRRPHHIARKQSDEMLRLVKRTCKRYKWRDMLQAYQDIREKHDYPYSYACFLRTARKLRDKDSNEKRRHRKNKPYQRAEYPGQKVQIDVKFVPTECAVDGGKYYQFTAVDECTRWTYREMYAEHSSYSAKEFIDHLVKNAPFLIREVQTDNGMEFTNFLRDKNTDKLTLFEMALNDYGIKYHRIKPGTPRHNGKVERQHRIDQLRFYDDFRMFNLEDGRKQLASYQRKSNDTIKICLGFRSPNQVLEMYQAIM